ncbi:MAG TPA: hypothetical protein VD905_14705 [Flavobacteriales bacterium]|nr:hypothetical protein [Flavobacteriales bacterium]
MNKTTGAGLGFALVFITLKCIFFITGFQYTHYNFVILANIVCVLLAVGLGMYVAREKNNRMLSSGIARIKAGIRGGAIYALVVSIFVFFYYNNIDKKFGQDKIKERVQWAEKMDFKQVQRDNPDAWGNRSRGDFIDEQKANAELFFSPFMITTVTLISLMIVSMIYAVVMNIIFKNLFFKPRL